MARHKDADWNLEKGNPGCSLDVVTAALLMDLRDELKELNKTLRAHNANLESIRRNTAWSRRKQER
jgi:hypothetical protein